MTELEDEGEAGLSALEQFERLDRIKGQRIAYRKPEPSSDDETTFLFKPRRSTAAGEDIITWMVADHLTARVRTRYVQHLDDTAEELHEADEIRSTRFVTVPRLRAMAIDDRVGDRYLGARSAAGRLKAILAQRAGVDLFVRFAGTSQDVDRALTTWALDHFSFTVRPSNPHPPKMGEKLEELLKPNNIGKLRGVATPINDQSMNAGQGGIIAEAKGLSDAGYGQYGASGTTPSGLKATLSSPQFDMVREKNIKRQSENRMLKIHIQPSESHDDENADVVKALVDLYG